MAEETRDRIKNPSINFPRTPEEAFQALLHAAHKALFEEHNGSRTGVLTRNFTTNSGMGTTRTEESARWLNEQQSLLRARLEDFIDQLDLESRTS